MGPSAIKSQQFSDNSSPQDKFSTEGGLHQIQGAKRQKTHHDVPLTMAEPHESDLASPLEISASTDSHVLETIQLEHVPASHSVHIAVFRGVENSPWLHQQLLARNAEYEYAFIDAGVITSRLQVLSAVFKAITVQVGGTMKTPNIHSEIVYSLSPAKNISEAYRRYGITPTTRDLVIVKVLITSSLSSSGSAAGSDPSESNTNPDPKPEAAKVIDTDTNTNTNTNSKPLTSAQDIEKHLLANVRGKPCTFTDDTLSGLTDWGLVRKYYKLNGVSWLDGMKDDIVKRSETDTLIMSGMALRGL
ncbi:CGI-121-domain-containing protein [Xylariaceae sp. FL1651]|nr:CGI-121-domain-containing protein [Xylariaceae sp. FL1651]